MQRLERGEPLDDLLAPYLEQPRPPTAERPWVLANMVTGLDGSAAVDGRVGELSSPADRRLFVDLRSVADVVLVGAETARREGYGPPKLRPELRAQREQQGRPPVPRIALVSRSLDLDDAASALEPSKGGQPPMVITCEASPADRRQALGERGVEVLVAGTDAVDPALALASLRRGSDVAVVLCEGGPSFLGGLLADGLLDELCLTVAPVVGGDPLPLAVLPSTAPTRRARLAHVLEADDDLFLRYLFEEDR